MYANMYMFKCTYACGYIWHKYTCGRVHVFMPYTNMHMYIFICTYIYRYIFIYTYMYVCINPYSIKISIFSLSE